MTLNLRKTFAVIAQAVPGRYNHLEKFLSEAPPEVANDFARLIASFDSQLTSLKQKARRGF